MTKYLRALVYSFYKPEIYREAIVNWKGIGGKYMVLLAAVLAIFLATAFYTGLYQFEQKELPHIVSQMPTITFDNGTISVMEKQPVVIQSLDKKFTATIDTTKTMTELRETKSQFAIGKDFALVQGADGTYKPVDLKNIKEKAVIDQNSIYQFLRTFKIVALPLLWLGQTINLIIKMLIVTVLSYAVTAFMREEYDFLTRMRLALLALTPALIITTGISLGFNHNVAPWFSMLVSCLYIYVMIVLMRRLPPVETQTSNLI